MRFRAQIGLLASILVAATVFTPVAQADDEPAVAPMQWGACPAGSLDPLPPEERHLYSCATYNVPMDYDQPHGTTISIALMRRAASNPAKRIGSLFLYTGGPGGHGYRLSQSLRTIFQPEVLEQFDLVGFDARGIGHSTPVRCFKTKEDADAFWARMPLVPVTQQQIDAITNGWADYSAACARNAGEMLAHMSSADSARDVNMLRRAVGDRQLNLFAYSSGALIGETYVNLFPGKTRAMVLDNPVDADVRVNHSMQYVRERALGWEGGLDAFLKLCAAVGPKCAFSAGGDPRAKYDELLAHLYQEPITLPGGFVLNLDQLQYWIDDVAEVFPYQLTRFATNLQAAYNVLHPSSAVAEFSNPTKSDKRGLLEGTPYTGDDSYQAVICADKHFPGLKPGDIPAIADRWEKQSPSFGRLFAFNDPLACSTWPVKNPDAYRGPWNQMTENPVLVYGNYYNGSSWYESSRRTAELLGNARLVSADAFGYGIVGASTCADDIATKYLISLRAPQPGVVCHPNVQPF